MTKNHAENLKIIFDNAPNILMLINDESRVEMINNNGAAFFGKKKENLLGLLGGDAFNCLNSLDGEGCGKNPECFHCPIRTRVTSTFQTRTSHFEEEGQVSFLINDKKISIDFLISTTLLKLNKINKVLLSLTNITDRKHMEKKQQESYFLFSQIFEQSTISTCLYNPEGTIIKTNPEFCKMFGVEEKTIINSGYNVFKDKIVIEEGIIPLWRKIFEDKKTTKWEVEYSIDSASKLTKIPTSKTGKIFLELLGYPILDSKGVLKYVVCQHYDITSRKRAEKALNESEARLKKAQSVGEVGSWEYDIAKGEIWGSEQAFQMYGIERTSPYLPLNEVEACIPDAQRVNKALVNLIQKNKKYDIEFEVHRKIDGKVILIRSVAELVFDNECPVKVLGVIHDITEQRKIEDRLKQSQKMESIGTLAGGIAHDFNNILFPITGHAELLLEDIPQDSPFRDSINQIYTSAMRAGELVKQILTFSRQDTNGLEVMKMQPIIKEALKFIRSTIPTTIEIKQNINPDCGVVKADPTKIHQIIMNLATNSYHAMEDTGGTLTVSLRKIKLGQLDLIGHDMKSGDYICLTVADTGVGMDKVLIDKIFDPFFTTKKKDKGTGMGLSVVHGIVKNMNGVIKVYSEPGQGTEFHVYLPMEKSSSEKQVTNLKMEIQGGTEHILLTDDEESILIMIKKMLERLGYKVTSYTNSIEALDSFRVAPEKFDMVITDMQMPNMTGDKFAAELIKIRPDIPILLCTGFSETMSEEKAISLGINGFLLKPMIMKDLSQKIREVLDKKK